MRRQNPTAAEEALSGASPAPVLPGMLSPASPQSQSPSYQPPSPRTTTTRRPSRRSSRPSTAPAEETSELLPSLLTHPSGSPLASPRSHSTQSKASSSRKPVASPEEAVRPSTAQGETYLGSRSAGPARPRSPALQVDSARPSSAQALGSQLDVKKEADKSDYDWATFIGAYSAGKWDPRRSPKPPRAYLFPPASLLYPISERSNRFSLDGAIPLASDGFLTPGSSERDSSDSLSSRINRVPKPVEHPAPQSRSPTRGSDGSDHLQSLDYSAWSSPTLPPPPATVIPESGMRFASSSHRVRSSAADARSADPLSSPGFEQIVSSSPEVAAAAATMRWAAARVNIAPLTLPSPEHELTDPMRGVTAAIPGSHNDVAARATTPFLSGRKRLGSFWQGTQDVENVASPVLPVTLSPRPSSDVGAEYSSRSEGEETMEGHGIEHKFRSNLVPATAPTTRDGSSPTDDYFSSNEQTQSLSSRHGKEVLSLMTANSRDIIIPASVPVVVSKRVCLSRQSSSPLPNLPKQVPYMQSGTYLKESMELVNASRAAKEEQMFVELEYLAPPNPADELERRRALYKFNILNTGPDLNFDRIAHLAKLVFNTKIVFISLIDGNEQWFKSESGMQMTHCPRISSFCAHGLLQRGDEPMVVLDSHLDWRFAKNPLVIGHPYIRFYAGAPLRTQDGYNIGSLSVVDDMPREEFNPRQRHTLKEFAAIAMREMELWRDKIQLRIRDRIQNSMEQFSRECLEIDTGTHQKDGRPNVFVGALMDKVYERAAKLVKRTLDVEGVIVLDVSQCEMLDTMNGEGSVAVVMYNGDPRIESTTRSLSSEEYLKLNAFFSKYPDGKISEGIVPPSFRPFLPTHIQYALTVPIFNIDKRPFALLCAYNASGLTKRFLEGHELSYLRAIGVIILSAVLKRRMLLADKAKSLFISNISHELRTPLHGILAAAELLNETPLNHSQASFLQTVQACGTSLVETVNHVLDFTKLSGNAKSGGVENAILPAKVDLIQLIEEAVDGCWIGHRARMVALHDFDIGSVYSPPKDNSIFSIPIKLTQHVETVVDISYEQRGWVVICEKGGIRRVLMNLLGNSLKFTTDGFVHVSLHQLPRSEDTPPSKVTLELSIADTGKGISQAFLKNQLFHPFSQENPLQTGTGLGLAIVNSIVQSESVGGKVDVSSEEGVGTEVKITFLAELVEGSGPNPETSLLHFDDPSNPPSVSLLGFTSEHRGTQLLQRVLTTWLSWWGFKLQPNDQEAGDIILLNGDDLSPVEAATQRRDTSRPFVCLSASRGSPHILNAVDDHERIGGFCRIVYKPGGPSRLWSVMKICLHALKIRRSSSASSQVDVGYISEPFKRDSDDASVSGIPLPRRNSGSDSSAGIPPIRPPIVRSSTAHPFTPEWKVLSTTPERDESETPSNRRSFASDTTESYTAVESGPTVAFGSDGTLLHSSIGTIDTEQRFRVLVVEDNAILRNLLVKWLQKKGFEYRDAEDGQSGVAIFEQYGPFDIVLLDMSMPILDGIGASKEIRRIESARAKTSPAARPTRILALTGMSSKEDKHRAFTAGVDGYLVKPVAFKTLEEMFHKLGA